MSDSDVRDAYRRALERSGNDPRLVAARLLGVDHNRFSVLYDRAPLDDPGDVYGSPTDGIFDDGLWPWAPRIPVTGYVVEAWKALWQQPILTVEDYVEVVSFARARGRGPVIWDASGSPSPFSRIEPGWRETRDGPHELEPSGGAIGFEFMRSELAVDLGVEVRAAYYCRRCNREIEPGGHSCWATG